jgi:hypothetical protein
MNPYTVAPLNNYAVEMGFASHMERLEMIYSVPKYLQDELERWMNEDGHKPGLEKILATRRFVRRSTKDSV